MWTLPVVLMGLGALATVGVAWLSPERPQLAWVACVVALLPLGVAGLAWARVTSAVDPDVAVEVSGDLALPLGVGAAVSAVCLLAGVGALLRNRRRAAKL